MKEITPRRFQRARLTAFLLISGFALSGCFDSGGSGSSGASVERFLYTSSNSSSGNEIIRMGIASDGTLSSSTVTRIPTHGFGDADDDDFDGQHSLHIVHNYLLAVNAGEDPAFSDMKFNGEFAARTSGNGTISVFRFEDDALTQVPQGEDSASSNVESHGIRPVSLTSAIIDDVTWVLVANQYDNPFCKWFDGKEPQCPAIPSPREDDKPSIDAFKFNPEDGQLTYSGEMDLFNFGDNGGPSQVSFSPDRSKVAATMWGIPFLSSTGVETIDILRSTTVNTFREGGVFVWDVEVQDSTQGSNLMLIKRRFWFEPGVSGSIGFVWSPDSRYLYVTNFNVPINGDRNFSVVSLEDTSSELTPVDQSGTRDNDGAMQVRHADEACWAWLEPDGSRLYTASFSGNIVSFFDVTPETGMIDHNSYYPRRDQALPFPIAPSLRISEAPDTKDIYVLSNGTFLYVSGALNSHTISIYAVNSKGTLVEINSSPFSVPFPDARTDKREEAFLGLVGY